jgi:methyl-accepting chemotaxis protein
MRDVKVGIRLGLAFGLLLALMVVAVTVAFFGIRAAQDQAVQLEHESVALLDAANAMQVAQLNEAVAIRDFVGQTNVDRQGVANRALQKSEKAYAQAVTTLAALTAEAGSDARLREGVARLKNANAPVTAKLREAMALSDQAEYPQAQAIVYDEVRPLQAAIASELQALVATSRSVAADRAAAGQAAVRNTELRLILVVLVALALGAAATSFITRGIVRPLQAAVGAAERVADGDLTPLGLARRGDETGRVLAALGSMQARLNHLVRGIRDSAGAVGRASDQIAEGNTELAARTEQQAASLEETAASLEQLTAVVKQNSDSAGKASELARQASALAEDSGQAVTGVVRTMEGIHSSSRKVSEIVGVIDEIAFQTNLLALNAAVEAARAGEQGRGFAVVAAQVRVLAQRSGEASKDIKQLVAAALGEAVQGSEAAARAGESMGKVVQVGRDLAQLVADIARASAEQRAGIEQVNATVSQMDAATQSNAALVQQVNGFIDALLAQARELQEATRRFRLDAGPGESAARPADDPPGLVWQEPVRAA